MLVPCDGRLCVNMLWHVCAGLVRDVLGGRDDKEEEHLRLRCALMRLSLPIDLLATQLLQLPLLDQLPA